MRSLADGVCDDLFGGVGQLAQGHNLLTLFHAVKKGFRGVRSRNWALEQRVVSE